MARHPIDASKITFKEPVSEMPARSGMVGQVDAISRQIVIGVMGLKDGECLPVEAPDHQTASRLTSRQHSKLFREYGIEAKMRGTTAYFYKGQKEGASEVNHQDQRLPLPPLPA